MIKGGRGGGKSQSIGRLLLYLGEKRKLRAVCGRETQNTISESVYSLLVDVIRTYNLNYEIQSSKLIHRLSGTEITFRGFRQQGAFNIQGMEGIDFIWIDEAQAITKKTMDVLIPTIRKDTAKVVFTMNPHTPDDSVVQFCDRRDDCMIIHVNYDENKHCTHALIHEAKQCKLKSEEDYEHIWLGKPLDKSEDAVFSMEELLDTRINKHPANPHYGARVAGFDIARYGDDSSACVIFQQMGSLHWEEIYCDEWRDKDLTYTTGNIMSIVNEYHVDLVAIDEDGIGAGPLDTLQKGRQMEDVFKGFRNPAISYKKNKDYANNRTLNTYKLKEMVRKHHIAFNTDRLMKELCTLRYTYDHYQRKILISKEKMRKEGVKSPNMADAAIMAASLIGEENKRQENQYRVMPQRMVEDNLFVTAGIR